MGLLSTERGKRVHDLWRCIVSLLAKEIQRTRWSIAFWEWRNDTPNIIGGSSYCIWSVISSFSILNRWSSSLGLFCHAPLKRDQRDCDWRLKLNDTPKVIGGRFEITVASRIYLWKHTCILCLNLKTRLIWKHTCVMYLYLKANCIVYLPFKTHVRHVFTFENTRALCIFVEHPNYGSLCTHRHQLWFTMHTQCVHTHTQTRA